LVVSATAGVSAFSKRQTWTPPRVLCSGLTTVADGGEDALVAGEFGDRRRSAGEGPHRVGLQQQQRHDVRPACDR
jgi:hypothetical protein